MEGPGGKQRVMVTNPVVRSYDGMRTRREGISDFELLIADLKNVKDENIVIARSRRRRGNPHSVARPKATAILRLLRFARNDDFVNKERDG